MPTPKTELSKSIKVPLDKTSGTLFPDILIVVQRSLTSIARASVLFSSFCNNSISSLFVDELRAISHSFCDNHNAVILSLVDVVFAIVGKIILNLFDIFSKNKSSFPNKAILPKIIFHSLKIQRDLVF